MNWGYGEVDRLPDRVLKCEAKSGHPLLDTKYTYSGSMGGCSLMLIFSLKLVIAAGISTQEQCGTSHLCKQLNYLSQIETLD